MQKGQLKWYVIFLKSEVELGTAASLTIAAVQQAEQCVQ